MGNEKRVSFVDTTRDCNKLSADTKKQITASEAKALSDTPTRLLNVIFRNIKEDAEMGRNVYMYTSQMCMETQEFVKNSLIQKGFVVRDMVINDRWGLSPTSNTDFTNVNRNTIDDSYETVRIVTFVISW